MQEIKGHLVLGRVVLPQKEQVRDLVALLDSSLSFETDVMVVPRLDYFNLLHMGLLLKMDSLAGRTSCWS